MPSPRVRIRAVLFDAGGTLIDVTDFNRWAELAAGEGWTVEPDALRHFFQETDRERDASGFDPDPVRSNIEFWRRILERSSGRATSSDEARRFVDLVHGGELPVRLFSDVRRCLDRLRAQRRRLGVVSNSTSEPSLRALLDRVGILPYFETVVSSGTEGVAKPRAEIFHRALERLRIGPGEAFFVGDMPTTDARGAIAAGLHAVWLNRDGFGLGTDPPEITSLLELPGTIAHLERPGRRGPAAPPRI